MPTSTYRLLTGQEQPLFLWKRGNPLPSNAFLHTDTQWDFGINCHSVHIVSYPTNHCWKTWSTIFPIKTKQEFQLFFKKQKKLLHCMHISIPLCLFWYFRECVPAKLFIYLSNLAFSSWSWASPLGCRLACCVLPATCLLLAIEYIHYIFLRCCIRLKICLLNLVLFMRFFLFLWNSNDHMSHFYHMQKILQVARYLNL